MAERTPGPTPSGGAYGVVRYLNDAGEEVGREAATVVELEECSADGDVIAVTTGYLRRGTVSRA